MNYNISTPKKIIEQQKPMLTVQDTAKILNVTVPVVRNLIKSEQLRAKRIGIKNPKAEKDGRLIRIKLEWIDEYLEKNDNPEKPKSKK